MHAIDNANDNIAINTIAVNEESVSNTPSKGGFHLPLEHKQLLSWIIGGLFVWCSIIICCILFIKRSTYFHHEKKSNQHKINISNMMGQIDDIQYHHAGRYNNQPSTSNSGIIEEEEDDSIEEEEIINQVKTMEKKRMSTTDKLVQELKLRQSQGDVLNQVQEVILEIDHARAPSSPVTNPVEYITTPPPPPPPGIAGVDEMGNVVQASHGQHGQTYANPNPGY